MTANPRNSAAIVPITNGRDPAGKFAPGNPGRVPGSKNRISNEALASIKSMKDEAIEKLRARLENNDWNALQFILERILPRGRQIEIDASSPSAIAEALASGQLTSEEAKNVATVLEKLASIEEITELRKRIERLEAFTDGN